MFLIPHLSLNWLYGNNLMNVLESSKRNWGVLLLSATSPLQNQLIIPKKGYIKAIRLDEDRYHWDQSKIHDNLYELKADLTYF